eukprot:TRINITY_DN54630_c0_g1_i1.p1 TRINITY_DN54630_c0_g1~~TRINITY_DN54630_c0_g1_i1.p1  ORF type:complete len:294 (+),score=36.70 TRINITY_DN54630_c0_g1_i1:74-955(+)
MEWENCEGAALWRTAEQGGPWRFQQGCANVDAPTSTWSWIQKSVADFATSWVGETRQCFGLPRRGRDLCFPRSRSTNIALVEEKRRGFAIALVAQFAVVICRVLAHEPVGAIVGVILFVFGNNARCSLATFSLLGFVATSGTTSFVDTWSLVKSLSDCGNHISPLLAQDHGHVATSIAAIMAPLAEIFGAVTAMEVHDVIRGKDVSRDLRDFAGRMATSCLERCSPVEEAISHREAESTDTGDQNTHTYCDHCRLVLPHSEICEGTGSFSGMFYCPTCWVTWECPGGSERHAA